MPITPDRGTTPQGRQRMPVNLGGANGFPKSHRIAQVKAMVRGAPKRATSEPLTRTPSGRSR